MSEIALYALALLCYAGAFAIFLNVLGDWSEEVEQEEHESKSKYPSIVDDPEGRN